MTSSSPLLSASSDQSSAQSPPYGARRVGVGVAVAAAGLGALYLGAAVFVGNGIPRGTTVSGVDIGGVSPTEAIAILAPTVGKRAAEQTTVTIEGKTFTIVPRDSGLSFDVAATVARAGSRTWNPIALIAQMTGSSSVEPVVRVDRVKLDAAVAGIAADNDSPAAEPAIIFVGTRASLTSGTEGKVLDRKAAGDAISAAYLTTSAPVDLPVTTTSPTVSDGAANQALSGAKTAVSAPVTVTIGASVVPISPAAIAGATTYVANGGALVLVVDGQKLRDVIAPRVASLESPGRDASWSVSSGKPVVIPSRVGKGVDAQQLGVAVAGVLDQSTAVGRTVVGPIAIIDPTLTTAQAVALGVVERVSSFTQRFPYAPYRKQNIGQAAKYINGALLLPGDTFSMNGVIKERTVANGYTKGFVIGAGGVFKEDLGGGVSTATTTVWTAAFYAGLQRVFTQAHSIWISRYRPGLEATVAWGNFDMKFRNNTPKAIFITTDMRNTSLTVTMWGTKQFDDVRAVSSARYDVNPFKTIYDESADCRKQSGEPGFGIDVTREFIKGGAVVKTEKIVTHYRPSPTVLCRADPSKVKPTPTLSGSGSPVPKPSGT